MKDIEVKDELQRLEKRLWLLETKSQAVRLDCPVCKHQTLAHEVWPDISVAFTTATAAYNNTPVRIQCFVCGHTFEKKQTWEQVGGK